MRVILSIVLTLSILHLSVEIWNAPVTQFELNEEIEQVVEDATFFDSWLHEGPFAEKDESHLKGVSAITSNDSYAGNEYFEVNPPPPEFA